MLLKCFETLGEIEIIISYKLNDNDGESDINISITNKII